MLKLLERKYRSMSYGELNLSYIDKLKLKDFYIKAIITCPDNSLKILLKKGLEDTEREISVIERIDYQIQINQNFICSGR